MAQQTAVDWLIMQLPVKIRVELYEQNIHEQAKQKEREQKIEFANKYADDVMAPMAQQTAVDWLVEQLRMQTPLYTKNEMIEIAKEMEREQHESTCVEVIERILDKLEKGENTNSQDVFNQYYNETYGK